jgi:hypothetical protein
MHRDFSIQVANRRRRRTEHRLEAVRFQLQHVVEEYGLSACLLTDSLGALLVSAESSPRELERAISVLRTPGQKAEDMIRRDFFLEGMRLTLTLVGAERTICDEVVDRIVMGVTRIHSTTATQGMRADLQCLADEGVLLA